MVRELAVKPKKVTNAVNDKNRSNQTNIKDVMKCRKGYFETHLNTGVTHNKNAIHETKKNIENIADSPDENLISRDKFIKVIKLLKNGKAPGWDPIIIRDPEDRRRWNTQLLTHDEIHGENNGKKFLREHKFAFKEEQLLQYLLYNKLLRN